MRKKGKPLATPGRQNNFRIEVEKYPGLGRSESVTLAGGKVYVCKVDSLELIPVFMDEDMTIVHPHPLVLDVDGSANVFIDPETLPATVNIVSATDEPVCTYRVE